MELYFAETCPCASEPGQRVFDVELEGKLAATIDIVSEAGWLRTHSVHLSSHVKDGSLTLELLGVVRNPILSALQVRYHKNELVAFVGPVFAVVKTKKQKTDPPSLPLIRHAYKSSNKLSIFSTPPHPKKKKIVGPIDFVANEQIDGARYTAPTIAPFVHGSSNEGKSSQIGLPEQRMLEANGKKFELAHISTGTFNRLDLRFETAYDSDPDVRVFRVDVSQSETSLSDFEDQCIDKCTKTDFCVAVFVRTLQTTYHCNGLSAFGRPVGTQSVSRSWKLAGALSQRSSSAALDARPDLVAAVLDANTASPTSIIFEGRTASNPSGPWLTFSTRFQRFHHVFALPLPPESCLNHCITIASCVGVILWEDPTNANVLMCLGVNAAGTKSGVETNLNCVSVMFADEDVHSSDGFPIDGFFGTILLANTSNQVSGGTIAGIICALVLSISVGLLIRWRVKHAENDDDNLARKFLWDSNGIMWERPQLTRRGAGILQIPQNPHAGGLTKRPSMSSVLHANDRKSARLTGPEPPNLKSMGRKAARVFNFMSVSKSPDGSGAGAKPLLRPPLERRSGGVLDTSSINNDSKIPAVPEFAVPEESCSNNDRSEYSSHGGYSSHLSPRFSLLMPHSMRLSVVLENDSLEEVDEPLPQVFFAPPPNRNQRALFAPPPIRKQLTPQTRFSTGLDEGGGEC